MNDTKNPSSKPPRASTAMPTGREEDESFLLERKPKKTQPLSLHEAPKVRTRGKLYSELAKDEHEKIEEDYYEFPSLFSRGIAFILDGFLMFALVRLSLFISPVVLGIVYRFLNHYKLEMWFSENVHLKITLFIVTVTILFFMAVIPVAFFNTSLGKKITGLRVRGDKKYTLSLTQVFKREILYKPLSVGLLVGFIMPFFDKKKKSLHDKLAGTFVVKD